MQKRHLLPLDTNHRISGQGQRVECFALADTASARFWPRRVAREHFPLERMTNFLRRAVEAIYGVISLVHQCIRQTSNL
jgi:hypothetical protein